MEQVEFEKRLRSAVGAGWWTLLIGVALLMVSWAWWMLIYNSPALTSFAEGLWGGMIKVAQMTDLIVLFFAVMKMILFLWFLAVIFMSIWLRKLRKTA